MTNTDLDKCMAENIMEWRYGDEWWPWWFDKYGAKMPESFHPTESISDAFQVVEKMMEKFPDWFFTLDVFGKNYTGKDRAVATFQESAEAYIIHSCVGAETRAKAICLACKAAIEELP